MPTKVYFDSLSRDAVVLLVHTHCMHAIDSGRRLGIFFSSINIILVFSNCYTMYLLVNGKALPCTASFSNSLSMQFERVHRI